MDTSRLRRELLGSVRLAATGERRLFGGAVAVAIAYVVWLVVTAVVLHSGFDVGVQPASPAAWEAVSPLALALGGVLWVLVPAAAVTALAARAVTDANGDVRQQYRLTHPFALVAPVLVVYGLCLAAGLVLGELSTTLLTALTGLGLFSLVRTVAASYRVFSFSRPRLTYAALFVSLAVAAVAFPVSVAQAAGRQASVEAAATGVGNTLATDAVEILLTGTATVADVAVPVLLGLSAFVPVASALGYFILQFAASLVHRLRRPSVRGAQLRTGQRHPDFAKPTYDRPSTTVDAADSSASNSPTDHGTSAGGEQTPDGAGDADDGGGTDVETADEDGDTDDETHTKVFTPPGDDEFDATAATEAETVVDAETSYVCPSCQDRFGADASFDYCPTCGSELEST